MSQRLVRQFLIALDALRSSTRSKEVTNPRARFCLMLVDYSAR